MWRCGVLLLSFVAIGCGPAAPEPVEVGLRRTAKLTVKPTWQESPLGLLSPEDDRKVKVGDSDVEALKVFPPSSSAKQVTELPPAIGLPYRVKGWEDRAGGFAVVVYEGRVALALRRTYTDSQELERTLSSYVNEYGDGTPVGSAIGSVEYRFWEGDEQRLMLSILRMKEGAIHLTEAIGTNAAMTAVGAEPTVAVRQKAQAEAELRRPPVPAPK